MASTKDQVRMLISDVGGDEGTAFLFSDAEVNAFLAMEPAVYNAAAAALRAISANEALVLKRIRILELDTDGKSVAEALLKTADAYDKRAKEIKDDTTTADDDDTIMEVVGMGGLGHASYREQRGLLG